MRTHRPPSDLRDFDAAASRLTSLKKASKQSSSQVLPDRGLAGDVTSRDQHTIAEASTRGGGGGGDGGRGSRVGGSRSSVPGPKSQAAEMQAAMARLASVQAKMQEAKATDTVAAATLRRQRDHDEPPQAAAPAPASEGSSATPKPHLPHTRPHQEGAELHQVLTASPSIACPPAERLSIMDKAARLSHRIMGGGSEGQSRMSQAAQPPVPFTAPDEAREQALDGSDGGGGEARDEGAGIGSSTGSTIGVTLVSRGGGGDGVGLADSNGCSGAVASSSAASSSAAASAAAASSAEASAVEELARVRARVHKLTARYAEIEGLLSQLVQSEQPLPMHASRNGHPQAAATQWGDDSRPTLSDATANAAVDAAVVDFFVAARVDPRMADLPSFIDMVRLAQRSGTTYRTPSSEQIRSLLPPDSTYAAQDDYEV